MIELNKAYLGDCLELMNLIPMKIVCMNTLNQRGFGGSGLRYPMINV